MQILVIGGTGFIGSHVVRQLVNAGHRVTLFHRGQTEADLPLSVEHIFGERQQLSHLSNEFERIAPEVVVDMFAYMEQDALTLMQTFRGLANRVVAISSQDVYRAYAIFLGMESGDVEANPLNEESPLKSGLYPFRALARDQGDLRYNYDKALVERVVMSDPDLPGTVLRLPAVYGPGDNQHRLFEHLKRMDDGRPAILLEEGKAQWRWTRGYVENVAAAIILAVTREQAANRIYNVGEADAPSETEWVEAIGRTAGWKGEVIALPRKSLPEHLKEPYDWRQNLVADTSRIRNELGYKEPILRQATLKQTVDWERKHPPKEVTMQRFNYAAEDEALASLNKQQGA
jgi:nucleoside-diphosphate-sugar epimerase